MLRVTETYKEPCALLLGGFDGLHRGHLALLNRAKETGLPVGLLTIAGSKRGGDLFTFPEREEIFSRAGLAFVREEPFTEEFRATAAEQFIRRLFSDINVKALFCGEDFRFGKGAEGDCGLLKALAPCPVYALPPVLEDERKISASTVKTLLAAGEVEAANRLLYVDYFLQGEVLHGRQEGRKYGFPTLNLNYPAKKFPLAHGVYAGRAETVAGTYPAIVNFGARPTFHVEECVVEAHLKGFSGDLYSTTARVYFERFLRPIVKFSSRDELQAQLLKDIESV